LDPEDEGKGYDCSGVSSTEEGFDGLTNLDDCEAIDLTGSDDDRFMFARKGLFRHLRETEEDFVENPSENTYPSNAAGGAATDGDDDDEAEGDDDDEEEAEGDDDDEEAEGDDDEEEEEEERFWFTARKLRGTADENSDND